MSFLPVKRERGFTGQSINHLSATCPSGTARRLQFVHEGFDSRQEPIAFDIYSG